MVPHPIRFSRRRALTLAAGTGAAALLASCGGDEEPQAILPGTTDEEILGAAIALEESASVAYEEALRILPELIVAVLAPFADHELAHAAALREVLGGMQVERRGRPQDVTAPGPDEPPGTGVTGVEVPSDPGAAVEALDALERRQVGAYLDALGRLTGSAAREVCARILVVQAQHLSELGMVSGRSPVPRALVDGSA